LAHQRPYLFFSYQGFATILAKEVTSLDLPVTVINLKEYDPDDHLVEEVGDCHFFFFFFITLIKTQI
jgi:tRNA wybutosine-synthesizing protein 1